MPLELAAVRTAPAAAAGLVAQAPAVLPPGPHAPRMRATVLPAADRSRVMTSEAGRSGCEDLLSRRQAPGGRAALRQSNSGTP